KNDGTERTDEEARGIGGERRQQGGRIVARRKKQRGKEGRQRRIEIKVIPLEDGAHRQTAQHPPRCACAADTASPPRPGWQIPVAPLARRGGRACHRCRRSLGGNTMPILKKKDWLSDRVRASQKVVAPATDRVGNNQPLATN